MRLPVRVRTQAEFVLAKFCREQIAPAVADQVRLEYEVHGLTAIVCTKFHPLASTPSLCCQRTSADRRREERFDLSRTALCVSDPRQVPLFRQFDQPAVR